MSPRRKRLRQRCLLMLLTLALVVTPLVSQKTSANRAEPQPEEQYTSLNPGGTEIIEASSLPATNAPLVFTGDGRLNNRGLVDAAEVSEGANAVQQKGGLIKLPVPNAAQLVLNGSITSGDSTQAGRLLTGTISNCAGTNTCPGPVDSNARHFDAYNFKNNSSNTECVTVQLNASACGGTFLSAAAYLNSYNPNNLCNNFLGVMNSTFNGTQSFSFNAPGNSNFVVVVYEASANTGCADYTLMVSSTNISNCPPDNTTTGSITASDQTQAGRLLTGTISNCAGTNTCPGPVNSTPRHFDSYTYINTSSTAECITVELDATGCAGQFMASASYLTSFNPANLCANFLGVNNSTFNGKQSYSFNVPAGATFVVVVYEATADSGCASYTLNVKSCASIVPIAVNPGDLLISEFRLRGLNGDSDEFIEIANATGADHTVTSISGTGYGIAASDGVTRCTIPNGTVIPKGGHFLCANSAGFSLASYPAGNGTTATADATYTTNIPDNAGIALFNNNTGGSAYSLANRLDAAGSASEANTLFKEGVGYPPLVPFSIDYSFYRDNCGKGGSIASGGGCTSGGEVIDTNNNANDFVFVDTFATSAGAGQRLGSPGPENLAGPVQRNANVSASLIDPCAAAVASPNRVRDLTADPANNSSFGTMDIRRTFTNNSGAAITRLRFRIIDITTFPSPSGIADLRLRTATSVVATVDRPPCGSGTSNITIEGTTLEQPPAQANGGGFNGTLSAGSVTLATPLANGASIDLRFLLGIQQTGTFRFFVNVEALP